MLATSDRVRPCRARWSARSVGRRTSSSSPSWTTSMSRDLRSNRSPRGPATRTTSGSTVMVTPEGTGMGFLPIRDMVGLPDDGQDLAADALLAGFVAGPDALGRGDDRGAHAAKHLRDVLGVDVAAAAGARDALEPADDGHARVGVLELDDEGVVRHALGGVAHLVGADVALLLQDPRHLDLQARRRDLDGLVRGLDAVADAGQEVGDGIGHRHAITSSTSSCR